MTNVKEFKNGMCENQLLGIFWKRYKEIKATFNILKQGKNVKKKMAFR